MQALALYVPLLGGIGYWIVREALKATRCPKRNWGPHDMEPGSSDSVCRCCYYPMCSSQEFAFLPALRAAYRDFHRARIEPIMRITKGCSNYFVAVTTILIAVLMRVLNRRF